jgi:hypothetical protein
MPLDHLVNLAVQPARVSKLDGDRPAKVGQQRLEQLWIPFLSRWELEQHRARAIAQRQHPGAEVPSDDVLWKPSRRIGQGTLGLEAKPKVRWGVAQPFGQRRLLRQPLEGDVDLDRIQLLRICLEKPAGRQVLGVEDSSPFGIAETTGSDVEGHRLLVAGGRG